MVMPINLLSQLSGMANKENVSPSMLIGNLVNMAKEGAEGVKNYWMEDSPIAIISRLVGLASTAPEQADLMKSIQGTPTENAIPPGRNEPLGQILSKEAGSLNPYQEGVMKGLKKSGELHATEAVNSEGPSIIPHILQQSGLNQALAGIQGANTGLSMASTGNEVQQQPQQPQQPQQQRYEMPDTNVGIGDILKQFIPGYGPARQAKENLANNQLLRESALQKLRGEEPLQKGEREKAEIEGINKFFENVQTASTKALPAESSKLLSNVNSGIKQLDLFSSELEKDPNVLKQWRGPGNAKGQILTTMREDIADIIGRLRSGGAISKDEEKRFFNQIPKIGIGASLENSKTAKFKINKLRNLMQEIKETVEPRGSDMSARINAALKAGATREQIYKIYKQGGL